MRIYTIGHGQRISNCSPERGGSRRIYLQADLATWGAFLVRRRHLLSLPPDPVTKKSAHAEAQCHRYSMLLRRLLVARR